jgi:hypothetical protein
LQEIESKNTNLPILIFTDLIVTDEQLNTIHPSFWWYSRINPSITKDFNYLCVHNVATGCTILMNKEAKSVSLPIPANAAMHDSWIALSVAQKGILTFITQPTVLYRQHNTNCLGAKNMQQSYMKNKILSFKKIISDNKKHLKMLEELGIQPYWLKYSFYKLMYFIRYKLSL